MTLPELIQKAKKIPLEPDPSLTAVKRLHYNYYDTNRRTEVSHLQEFLFDLAGMCVLQLSDTAKDQRVLDLQIAAVRFLLRQIIIKVPIIAEMEYFEPRAMAKVEVEYISITLDKYLTVSHTLPYIKATSYHLWHTIIEHYERQYGPPVQTKELHGCSVRAYTPPPQAKNLFTLLQWFWHEFPKLLLPGTPFQDYSEAQLL